MGWPPSEVERLSAGVVASAVGVRRIIDYQETKVTELRIRKLSFFASSMLDHKGKTPKDLYPLWFEGKNAEKVSVDTGALMANELQRRLNKKKEDAEKGFDKIFGIDVSN